MTTNTNQTDSFPGGLVRCTFVYSDRQIDTIRMAGRWLYRVETYTVTAVATQVAEVLCSFLRIPGVYHCAETILLRDGRKYGKITPEICETSAEARNAALAKRIAGALKRAEAKVAKEVRK
jgi:hypothetical protein